MRYIRYPLLAALGVLMAVLCAADLFSPDRTFSQMENRYLTAKPRLTWRGVREGEFMEKYEEYQNDQFVLRDGWISLKSLAETALGKVENNGVVYGEDGYLFDKYQSVDAARLERNRDHVEAFGKKHPELSVTFTLIPSSYAVLPDKLPAGLNNVDQLEWTDRLYAGMGEVGVCDVAPALKGEGMYYRTDHHWTTAGAYAAYRAYLEGLGIQPAGLEGLESHVAEGFYGTYYSKAKLVTAKPDAVAWYDIPAQVWVEGEEVGGLYDLEKLQERDKYAAFLHGNNGVTVIRREGGGESAGRVLLIKDSYGNSLAPFLALSFDEVVVADLRYLTGIEELLDSVEFRQVYILYGFSTFDSDTNVYKLGR